MDPSYVLGLKLGEAAVIRNAGGRVTPATLRAMAMLAKVRQANSDGRPAGDSHVVVLHHTDRGMADLAAFPDVLAEQDSAERLGDRRVVAAEPDEDGAVVAGDLAGGHGGDP